MLLAEACCSGLSHQTVLDSIASERSKKWLLACIVPRDFLFDGTAIFFLDRCV